MISFYNNYIYIRLYKREKSEYICIYVYMFNTIRLFYYR